MLCLAKNKFYRAVIDYTKIPSHRQSEPYMLNSISPDLSGGILQITVSAVVYMFRVFFFFSSEKGVEKLGTDLHWNESALPITHVCEWYFPTFCRIIFFTKGILSHLLTYLK